MATQQVLRVKLAARALRSAPNRCFSGTLADTPCGRSVCAGRSNRELGLFTTM